MSRVTELTAPGRLFARDEALAKPCPIPAVRGVYGWYFKSVPPGVPTHDCITVGDMVLLYVGISPKNERSSENLRKRIAYHFRGNAEGSTLRMTLGVLLSEMSDCPLKRVGSGKRLTFTHIGEQWLDEWMADNARVCWLEHPEPWILERAILQTVSLPLNIQENGHHPFSEQLSGIRRAAKAEARSLPIANEGNQARSA